MPFRSEKIPCNFVGSFKVGDNLVFNCKLLSELTEANKDGVFNKPVVLQVGSILEAALAEIIYRAQNFSREGVSNISEADRLEIAGKKIDKLSSIIDVMKKYKILDTLGVEVYDDLHKLRKYRNKVHIQDDIEIAGVSRDEEDAFSNAICTWAIELNKRVIKHLSENLARPKELGQFVESLRVPSF
jgi:Asp-tRNA(Asn)/Glu-tRNA(Gln) amidotransferase C subunit